MNHRVSEKISDYPKMSHKKLTVHLQLQIVKAPLETLCWFPFVCLWHVYVETHTRQGFVRGVYHHGVVRTKIRKFSSYWSYY